MEGYLIFYTSLLCGIWALLISTLIGFKHFLISYVLMLLLVFVGGYYFRKWVGIK